MKFWLELLMMGTFSLHAVPFHEYFTKDEIEVSEQGFWVHFDEFTIKCDALTYCGYGFYRICDPDFGICPECGEKMGHKKCCSNKDSAAPIPRNQ